MGRATSERFRAMTNKTIPDNIAGYIVCGSNRARDKAFGVIGRNRQAYNLAFTDHDINHRGIYPVTVDELSRCIRITGVRQLQAKRVSSLSPCWSCD